MLVVSGFYEGEKVEYRLVSLLSVLQIDHQYADRLDRRSRSFMSAS